MKKLSGIFLAIVLTLSCFVIGAGCGDGGYQGYIDSEGVAHVVFMGRDEDNEKLNYKRIVDKFNASQNSIKVRLEWFTDASGYNVMLDGLGKNLPDCLMLSNAMFLRYVSAGKLYDFKSRMIEDELSSLYTEGYSAYCYDPATGKLGISDTAGMYGLPKDMGPYALCYNVNMLTDCVEAYNKANTDKIDLERVTSTTNPMTFSEFITLGKKLKPILNTLKNSDGNVKYKDSFVCSAYDLQSAVYSNNANFFTDDNAEELAIDSDNFAGAVSFIQQLYKEEILPSAGKSSTGAETLFTSGRAMFFYTGPWKMKTFWESVEGFEWDIIPVLCGDAEGSVSTSYVGGMGLCVSANSAVKNQALTFLKYVALDVGAQRDLYGNGQCIPNLTELAEEFSTNSQNLLKKPQPLHRGVWIDCVNGTSETDKVGGKYRAEAYTYSETWFTDLSEFMSGNTGEVSSFWKADNSGKWTDVAAALKAKKPDFQRQFESVRNQYVNKSSGK